MNLTGICISRLGLPLHPANNESASKKKFARYTKAGQYLKPLLIQCVFAAVKSRKELYFMVRYQHFAKRRGKKKAIIAIAGMMLTSIYHMWVCQVNPHAPHFVAPP